jgi:hypothetical protein
VLVLLSTLVMVCIAVLVLLSTLVMVCIAVLSVPEVARGNNVKVAASV